jgi:hypothetical protein
MQMLTAIKARQPLFALYRHLALNSSSKSILGKSEPVKGYLETFLGTKSFYLRKILRLIYRVGVNASCFSVNKLVRQILCAKPQSLGKQGGNVFFSNSPPNRLNQDPFSNSSNSSSSSGGQKRDPSKKSPNEEEMKRFVFLLGSAVIFFLMAGLLNNRAKGQDAAHDQDLFEKVRRLLLRIRWIK